MFLITAPAHPVQVMRFALTGGSPPDLTETLAIGDLARQAVLSLLGTAPTCLTGHALDGPSRQQHRHPFFLPGDENGDGLIDHLTVYCPQPLQPDRTQLILDTLTNLWTPAGRRWELKALGAWTPGELQAPGGPWAPATVWESATPFVLTRFPKRHHEGRPKLNHRGEQIDGPEDQIRRELQHRLGPDTPPISAICRMPAMPLPDGRSLSWLRFNRNRQGGGKTSDFAYGLRLTFAVPVAGPICLGYGCHFGLGQFRPVTEIAGDEGL